MLKRILILLALLALTNTRQPYGQQQPAAPHLTPAELEELLRRAEVRVNEYRDKFKDLTAEEEQELEEYDADGKLKRRRRVVSDLIIYQSQLDPSTMSEYRDVREVDGRAVAKREERLVNLFGRVAKADSVKKELDRITRESQRYDLRYSVNGFTLFEGLLLSENLRPSIQYTAAGREQISGRDVIVLQYQQVAYNPELAFKLSSLPKELKGAETRYRGRLWLDAETAQLWREERDVMMQHPALIRPLLIMRFEFEYAGSTFGILTPHRVVFSTYDKGRTAVDKTRELGLGTRVTFKYTGFRRFNVGTPDESITPPAKP